jgi:hypothetical protein
MFSERPRLALVLSALVAAFAGVTAAGGLLLPDLYRDNAFVRATWIGNDAVTLFLAVPAMIGASILVARGGGARPVLFWLGLLDYMLYNYAFYLFGAAFNSFFLLYAGLLALSMLALVFALSRLDLAGLAASARPEMPVRWIAGYFLLIASGLSAVYVAQSIGFITTGRLPDIVRLSGHPTSIVFALDLTLLVPWLVLGSVWLLQRKSWGYVIAGIFSIKGALYTLVLSVNSWIAAGGELGRAAELPLWGTLTVLGVIVIGLFYGNMRAPA